MHLRRWRLLKGRREVKPPGRQRDMRRDPVFLQFYDTCHPYSMTSMERLYGVYTAINYIVDRRISGDIVECGVWRGGSMMMAALTLRHRGDLDRRIFLFDTFEGMARPSAGDHKFEGPSEGDVMDRWTRSRRGDGGVDWNRASLRDVEEALGGTRYPGERLEFVKGPVEETLPSRAPERIAVLRLDTDFYSSTRHELQTLFPRLVSQGILMVDDYGTWAGSAQAVDEYFDEQGPRPYFSRMDAGGRLAVKW